MNLVIGVESGRDRETLCLGIAAGLHLALFVWNPAIFKDTWRALSGIGNGVVVIIDGPGPQTAALPGPAALRPAHTLAPLAVAPAPGKAIPHVPPPPLVSRAFHAVKMPDLPFQSDPGLGAAPSVVPIQLDKGAQPVTVSHAQALIQNRTRVSPIAPSGDVGLPGEGGTGRVLIRTIEPASVAPVMEAVGRPGVGANGPLIEGPLSNRTVLHRVIPEYPFWAEERGITGAVRLYFTVDRDGKVQSMIRVDQTSGYPELDRVVIDALRRWRFSPGAADRGNAWGIVTFNFSLSR